MLLDVNIFISYLLPSRTPGAIGAVVEAAIHGVFTLLLPLQVVQEFSTRIATKRYLAQRIQPERAAKMMDIMLQVAEIIPPLAGTVPAVTRDRKDDYLLACALAGRADYLVTGDDDLLQHQALEAVRIVSPSRFLEVLAAQGKPE